MSFLSRTLRLRRSPGCLLTPIRGLTSESLDLASVEDRLRCQINKIKTLAAEDEESLTSDPLFLEFQEAVGEGLVSPQELLSAVQSNQLTHRDLHSLERNGALSLSRLQGIQTMLNGGRAELSLTEVKDLLQNGLLGKEDLIRILKRGDLSPEDLRFLVKKSQLPSPVLQSVLNDLKDESLEKQSGISEAMKGLENGSLMPSKLESMVLEGALHPEDLELLVSENLLKKSVADKILEEGVDTLTNVYEEVEKFAELVEKGRFTFEELEVMRAKGVLGSALVHYLVIRDAIDEFHGQKLLEIEEDYKYLDPEMTDDEQEDSLGLPNEGIESDEGFYPKDVSKDDIFGLWDHLSQTYSDRPAKDDYFESYQDATQRARKEHQQTSHSSTSFETKEAPESKLDADGNATAIGRRKTSTAQVTLKSGTGQILINNCPLHEYFVNMDARCYVISPFLATQTLGSYDVDIQVEGGGWSGQAQAIRHGIAKALVNFNPSLLTSLKELGLTTRDARVVERKKPGKAKARKSFQWVKR